MAKKIVQLENNDGDQIFPISATDIALPGTKVAMRSASDPVIISTTRVSIVSTTVDSDGDYLAIGSVSAGSGSQDAIYCYAFIDNGTDNTTYVTNISTVATGRPCMTVMGKITGLHQGDTVRLSAQTQSSSYSTSSRDQSLALIKLPTGAPTYKGGALIVTLNTDHTWSGGDYEEIRTAIKNGTPVLFHKADNTTGEYMLATNVSNGFRQYFVDVITATSTRTIILNDNDRWGMENSYSIQETKTGETWLDGKPIYKQTITRSSTGGTTIAHGISNFGTLVKIEGSAYDSTSRKYIALPSAVSGASTIGIWTVSTTEVTCTSTVNDPFTWNVTLYYTKTTD